MNILLVQPWIRQGGAELLSVELCRGIERLGHQASIAALFVDPHGLPDEAMRLRYHLPPRWIAGVFARSRPLALTLGPLVLLFVVARAAGEADLVDAHNLPAPIVAAAVARWRGLPVMWHLNEVPLPLAGEAARRAGAIERTAWRAGAALARRLAHVPVEILVLSEKTRRDCRTMYGRDATVVPPGIDRVVFASDGTGAVRTSARLLCVGKLHPQKNPGLAVRTLARVRARHADAELDFVGEGALRSDLEALARRLGVDDAVRFHRRVSLSQLASLYRGADVLLVTARDHQSWGLTPFEALAAGTPAVVSAEIGAAPLLSSRGAALVVAPEESAFAEATGQLLEDRVLAERLVANGRALLDELTWERYAKECAHAFDRAIRGSRSARD